MSETKLSRSLDGGTISFEDGRKPAEEYAPARKVRVELSFSTFETNDPDAEAVVAYVGDLAKAQVRRLLDTTAVQAPAAPAAEAPAPAKRTRAPKVTDTPPAADEGFTPAEDPSPPVSPPTSDASPGTTDEWGAPAAEEIADKALTDAASKHSQRLADAGDANGTVRIRKLIGTFNPDPTKAFSLTQLPQEQRADFLAKVAALQPGQE